MYARGQFWIGFRGGVDPDSVQVLDGKDDDDHKLHYLKAGWATRLVGAHGRHGH